MSDQKNMFVAIALSIMILLGWQMFYEKPRTEKRQAIAEQQRLEDDARLKQEGVQTPGPQGTDMAGIPAAIPRVPGPPGPPRCRAA